MDGTLSTKSIGMPISRSWGGLRKEMILFALSGFADPTDMGLKAQPRIEGHLDNRRSPG